MSKLLKICIFISFFIFFQMGVKAQNTIVLTGKAIDEISEQPVEAATVFLSSKKDSTVLEYSLTDINGDFKIELKKISEPVFFSIADDLYGDYTRELGSVTENMDLGTVKLSQKVNLEGVVISGDPPIRIKNDTLEFNAASFKVRPDANVEALLKELPGVDIDEEGKITVNGKEVNQILVNGKPFFDKDGKIALENLPAEIINKVQITDTKTKKEELSKEKASSNNATINLTIDKDKNKGIIAKAMAGYGTDDRYESSALFNYFKGDSRISVLGSSNNINSVGFSMNEIFDNMAGSRNNSMSYGGGGGSFDINGMRFGGGKGITQSDLGGISYSDSFGKNVEFNGNYFYTQADTRNNNISRQKNLLPDNIFTTDSRAKTENQSFSHNFSNSFEMKIDSTSSIWFEPKYSLNQVQSSNIFEKFSVNEADELLNESYGEIHSQSTNQNFSNVIDYYKSFKNKTELSLEFTNDNNRKTADDYNLTQTFFYQTGDPDDIRDQKTRQINARDRYNLNFEYKFRITDSLKVGVGSGYETDRLKNTMITNDFDVITGTHSQFNDLLSSDISSDFRNWNSFASVRLQKKKYYIEVTGGFQLMNQDNLGFYLGEKHELDKKSVMPLMRMIGRYRFTDRSSMYINYNYDEKFASAEQLLDIENLSNPLNTVVGNPDLKSIRGHSVYMGYNNFNFQNRTGFNAFLGGSYDERNVVNYTTTDENFKSTTTYLNVDGNYMVWGGFNMNQSFASGKSKFRVGAGLSGSHNYRQGFINGERYTSKLYAVRPRINFNWEIKDLLTINPSYNLNYQFNNFKNYTIDRSDNIIHVFKVATTNYWPKHFVFGNDFSYTYNSNIGDKFQRDFFLWNTSLGYNFWNDKLVFKVKVFDVLGQNIGVSRTIGETIISDTEDDVLRRYVMFSLGFNLDKFAGKKKRGGRFMQFD